MTDRRNRSNSLGFTCMIVVSTSHFTGIGATICTDAADLDGFTNVLLMCSSGTMSAGHVVVDTYNTGVLDYDSCQCTVRQANTGPFDLQINAYPGTAPASICGSVLRFTRQSTSSYTVYGCQQITGDVIDDFTHNDILTITLSRSNPDNQWQSGHCILIKSDVKVTVTCEKPAISPTLSSTTTTTTKRVTTTTTTQLPSSTETTTTDIMSGRCKCHHQPDCPLAAVIVPIVITLLLMTLASVANVILYKRRRTLVSKSGPEKHEMTAPLPAHYDIIDQSRVEPPNTYEEISSTQTYVNEAMNTS